VRAAELRAVSEAGFGAQLAAVAAAARAARLAEDTGRAPERRATQVSAPAQDDPCAENKELEGRRFRLSMVAPEEREPQLGAEAPKPGKKAKDLVVNFRYAGSCEVVDRTYDGDRITPIAYRKFSGDGSGYNLLIATELGAKSSSVTLTQSPDGPDGGFLNAASVMDARTTADLLADKTFDLPKLRVSDFRGRARELHGDATFASSAPPR
ncbi:MAG TPA: hypothetical protein VNI01_08225, partial [Elusimicrobiota bacterium]|nr:hypothetical protein [Elusimicrobiota bacterium]